VSEGSELDRRQLVKRAGLDGTGTLGSVLSASVMWIQLTISGIYTTDIPATAVAKSVECWLESQSNRLVIRGDFHSFECHILFRNLRAPARSLRSLAGPPGFEPGGRRSCSLRCAGCDVQGFKSGLARAIVTARSLTTRLASLGGRSVVARGRKVEWTRRDLNPGPLPCEGSDLPLIYEPAWNRARRIGYTLRVRS
jgi:hypothetical protein